MPDQNPYEPSIAELPTQPTSAANGRVRLLIGLGMSALVGFGVWALSPVMTGQVEPWDGPGSYYAIALSIGGLCVGCLAPDVPSSRMPHGARAALAFAGVWLGQLTAGLVFIGGPLLGIFIIGSISTGVGSVLFLPGFAVGSLIRGMVSAGRSG